MADNSSLLVTHQMTVDENHIDHLGHMNVRFYGVAAEAASRALAARFGVGETAPVSVVDAYTRHHREQLLGAELEVRSGALATSPSRLRLYHELRNPERDEIAATFVYGVEVDGGFNDTVLAAAADHLTDIPEYGQPRSIDLDANPLTSAPSLDLVNERELAMRHPRAVNEDECDDNGNYLPGMAPMLTWGGRPLRGESGPFLHNGPNGEKMGWASMETRMACNRLPRLGDRIQAFGANLAIADKITHRIQWAYDLDTSELLCSFEVISLAFDTISRRAMQIPPEMRELHELGYNPDLAPEA